MWRDQERLRGGARWPRALGEAISTCDFFLLCWSGQAKASDFVDLEWNTALALKKPIVPYLLDDTPLPPTLSAVHGVRTPEAVREALTGPNKVSPGQAPEYLEAI